MSQTIVEQEIVDAQIAWGEGIVKIGKIYTEGGDYSAAATEHINKFYNYQEGSVLFKPTLAAHIQFRPTFEGALSYFVGSNSNFPEDHGFAIKPWSAVRWESAGTQIFGSEAIAMGNYFFTPAEGGEDVKVEYSFAYTKDSSGALKIILHGSHLPYNPEPAA
ncbi:MAG: phosphoribosyl-AMP cyclohydrolase [Bacteroidota bacterium]